MFRPERNVIVIGAVNPQPATGDPNSGTPTSTPLDAGLAAESPLRGARILLAEDNEINQRIAVELLESFGATVAVANNGREAVEKALHGAVSTPFQLVLMDLKMPEMDGYQATKTLRADARLAGLPIIAMTAHASPAERQRCLDAGMNDHLSKDFEPETLVARLLPYLSSPPSPPASPMLPASPPPVLPVQAPERPPPWAGRAEGDHLKSGSVSSTPLPNIEGLDTSAGLSRVAGNEKLYLNLLRRFLDEQGLAPGQIVAALARGEFALAERLAHTVRGVAGSLGASEPQLVAATLETAIAVGASADALTPLVEEFARVLNEFSARLRAALPATMPAAPPSAPAAQVEAAVARRVVGQLIERLTDFDFAAIERFEADRDLLRSIFSVAEFAALEEQLNRFAFVEALDGLRMTGKADGLPPVRTPPRPARNSRILIVDDTPANIQILAAVLRERGYLVSVATHGKEVFDVLARAQPDLILLDVMMPEMDGFETCWQLKAGELWRHIPVIFITAKSETTDVIRGFELGAVDYVTKPFNPHELLARVNTHLTIDRLHRENERLLLNILPEPVARRLKRGEECIADHFDAVSVLFADLVGFTTLSRSMPPHPLVELLNDLFVRFDQLAARHGVEKIKTIGDCYMAVCGVPEARADHASQLAEMALEMSASLREFNEARGSSLKIRIGLNSGPVVAGVIGSSKFIYDLWGDTVNTASGMESTGVPSRIQVSESTQRLLETEFDLEPRGEIEVKGKARQRTWFLVGRKGKGPPPGDPSAA